MRSAVTQPDLQTIDHIRRYSRMLVREFGFLDQTIAGTDLSASAVHAIVEIAEREGLTAKQLGAALLLEKSTVSRLLGRLVAKGFVEEMPLPQDGRAKALSLTQAGRQTLARIEGHAVNQVVGALSGGDSAMHASVEAGLRLYAEALGRGRLAPVSEKAVLLDQVRQGYAPGLCGRIAELHALYYSRLVGFGLAFETQVAGDMAEFLGRLEHPNNGTWRVERAGHVLGGLSIDGEDLGRNIAHLRWFILDGSLRGAGFGNKLMQAAMDFCRDRGFDEVHLWTFRGLDAARALYEKYGFQLVEERQGDQWGKVVSEQKFMCNLRE